MKTSTDRILTTHVGSLPRPETIRALLRARVSGQAVDETELSARAAEAVATVARQQAAVGLDVISDGEMGKTSFLAYADERLTGFVPMAANDPAVPSSNAGGSWARRIDTRREWRAFREYYENYLPRAMPPSAPPSVCQGPISYKGHALLQRDLRAFRAALEGLDVEEAFVPAIAPAMVGRGQNRHYATEDEYVFAIAEALKTEYRAIVDAGFVLQIDDPGLGETWDMLIPAPPLEEYRRMQARNIEALNHALAGIPEERVRYHLCWAAGKGRTSTTSACATSRTSCCGSGPRPTLWKRRRPVTRTSGASGRTSSFPRARCSFRASSRTPRLSLSIPKPSRSGS